MFYDKVPFSVPDIGSEEICAVVECLKSGWLTSGSRVATFERDFAEFVGGGVEAVAVSSATAGLEIALAAHGIGVGDEVITPDYTFTATAMSIVKVGATPVVVDIDSATFNLDPGRLEAAVTPRTRAIIPVHFAGLSCNMTAIDEVAKRNGLKVIEDAAHALPSKHNNCMIGNGTSDATVFSFYATKTLTTGEGGMITFTNPEMARRARILRLHGIDKDAFSRSASDCRWGYDVVAAGFKSNMTDIAAAIGIVQLKRGWDMHSRRRKVWEKYDFAFSSLPVTLPPKGCATDLHSLHLYALRLNPSAPVDRDTFVTKMAEAGVDCGVHFIPLHRHKFWRETLSLKDADFPSAQQAFECEVSLPLFACLTDEMQKSVIDNTRRLLS